MCVDTFSSDFQSGPLVCVCVCVCVRFSKWPFTIIISSPGKLRTLLYCCGFQNVVQKPEAAASPGYLVPAAPSRPNELATLKVPPPCISVSTPGGLMLKFESHDFKVIE